MSESKCNECLPLKGDGGSFDEIRPYAAGEVKQAVESLLADRQFSHLLRGFVPWMPKWMRNGLIRLAFVGVNTPLQFQLRFIKPVLKRILKKCSTGYSLSYSGIAQKAAFYLLMQRRKTGSDQIRIPDSVTKWSLMMNVSRPSLHRELKRLEAQGIISYHSHIIEILDPDSLQTVLG